MSERKDIGAAYSLTISSICCPPWSSISSPLYSSAPPESCQTRTAQCKRETWQTKVVKPVFWVTHHIVVVALQAGVVLHGILDQRVHRHLLLKGRRLWKRRGLHPELRATWQSPERLSARVEQGRVSRHRNLCQIAAASSCW
eukprot:2126243-Prymnesium_polylepis.1